MFRHGLEARPIGDILEQHLTYLPRNTASLHEIMEEVVANRQHRCMSSSVAEHRLPVEPGRVKHDLVRGLINEDRAADQFRQQVRLRGAMGNGNVVWHERRPHDVAHQRNMNTDLQLDGELVNRSINLRVR